MTDEELRKFLDNSLADLPVGDADDPVNFVLEAINCINRWLGTYDIKIGLDKPAFCCFVNCDRVRQVAEKHAFNERQYFRDDPPQDLLGKLYVCAPTLQSVYSGNISVANVDDVLTHLVNLDLADYGVVIFNAASKKAFWRYSSSSDLLPIELGDEKEQLKSADFDNELDRFYIECTATPDGFVKPWKNAKELRTKDDLELEIRNILCLFLKLRHKNWLWVDRESFQPTGRADLKVYFISERVMFFLELKVFRAQHSDTETVEWGKSGVTQAHGYRLANDPSGVAYLCCYDARKDNVEISEVKEFAESLDVRYRRYFIYSSAKAFQRSLRH